MNGLPRLKHIEAGVVCRFSYEAYRKGGLIVGVFKSLEWDLDDGWMLTIQIERGSLQSIPLNSLVNVKPLNGGEGGSAA